MNKALLSPADKAIADLDKQSVDSKRRQETFVRIALVLGVASAVSTLFSLPIATALLFAGIAWEFGFVKRHSNEWAKTRSRVERLHALKFRYRMRMPPFRDDDANIEPILREAGLNIGPDSSWDVTRSLPTPERVRWYLKQRVESQTRQFYKPRKTEFSKKSRFFGAIAWGVQIAALFFGLLQVVGRSSHDFVAPLLAIASSAQVWVGTRKLNEVKAIYTETYEFLSNTRKQILLLLDFGAPDKALQSAVEKVENRIGMERDQWDNIHGVDAPFRPQVSPIRMDQIEAFDWITFEGQPYVSISEPVSAVKLSEARTWTTDSGNEATAKAGDWLLTSNGDSWTVNGKVFEATYSELEDGRYKKTAAVIARRVVFPVKIETLEGLALGKPGDVALAGVLGDCWIQTEDSFQQRYEPQSV